MSNSKPHITYIGKFDNRGSRIPFELYYLDKKILAATERRKAYEMRSMETGFSICSQDEIKTRGVVGPAGVVVRSPRVAKRAEKYMCDMTANLQ